MYDPQEALDRAERALERDYHEGRITMDEFNTEMREVARDYRAEAEEAAERAYSDELDRW